MSLPTRFFVYGPYALFVHLIGEGRLRGRSTWAAPPVDPIIPFHHAPGAGRWVVGFGKVSRVDIDNFSPNIGAAILLQKTVGLPVRNLVGKSHHDLPSFI